MKAAIYTRVSSQMQVEDGFSLEAQHDILMDLLEKKGLQLYRVYSDPGVSGGSFKRPGVQMMIQDMKAKKFDTILVHKLDRLSRNLGDLYGFIDLINKLDCRLIIAAQGSEEIDTRSPMGKAFLFFSGIWAQIYLENLREETLKGLTKKAQKGGRHMSKPPLGYTFVEDMKMVIVEEEAKLVRDVFRLFLKGWGVTKIAKHMNTFSTTKEGGKWDNKSVRNVVTNPTYAGYNHFKPEHWPEEKRIITDGEHEPIVSREDFEKAKTFRERRSNGTMSKRSYAYAYSGIVKCSKCGANYTGNATTQNNKVYKSYRCLNNYLKDTCDSPSISERAITNLVFEKLLFVGSEIKPKEKPKKSNQPDLQKEVETSNRRKKNWMLALGDGKLSPDDYAMLIDEEEGRMKKIYEQLQEDTDLYTPEIPIEELRNMMLSIRDNWELIEPENQKELIQSMFRRIVIKKEKNGWEIDSLLTV